MLRCSELGDGRAFGAYSTDVEGDSDNDLPTIDGEVVVVHDDSPHANGYWENGGWFDAKTSSNDNQPHLAPPLSVFLDRYPQGYFGSSQVDPKTNSACPLWICKVGKIKTNELVCFTSMRTVLQYVVRSVARSEATSLSHVRRFAPRLFAQRVVIIRFYS